MAGVVLGEPDYARKLLAGRKLDEEQQTTARQLRRRARWEEVVQAAEKCKGGKWEEWAERHGDWGRDAAIYVAVRHGRMWLAEVVRRVKPLRYQAAAQAVKRFGEAIAQDPERRRFAAKLAQQISII